MIQAMARNRTDGAKPDEPSGDTDITTMKVYKRLQKKIAQVAALLDTSQPQALARYEDAIDEDLRELLARRQAELAKKKPQAE